MSFWCMCSWPFSSVSLSIVCLSSFFYDFPPVQCLTDIHGLVPGICGFSVTAQRFDVFVAFERRFDVFLNQVQQGVLVCYMLGT